MESGVIKGILGSPIFVLRGVRHFLRLPFGLWLGLDTQFAKHQVHLLLKKSNLFLLVIESLLKGSFLEVCVNEPGVLVVLEHGLITLVIRHEHRLIELPDILNAKLFEILQRVQLVP